MPYPVAAMLDDVEIYIPRKNSKYIYFLRHDELLKFRILRKYFKELLKLE